MNWHHIVAFLYAFLTKIKHDLSILQIAFWENFLCYNTTAYKKSFKRKETQ